jgi:hypothetical protein
VAEGARLESVYTLIRIEGSNPSLSARICPRRIAQSSPVIRKISVLGNVALF